MSDHAAVVREALQTRADGALLVSLHADGTETVFCGDQGGEYVGWQERSYADSKGWTYRADADNAAIAAIAALDALVAERDNAVAKGQSRLRCWLFGHDWKRREWHVLGTCDRCGKKEAGS
jgi:hypothetical protein